MSYDLSNGLAMYAFVSSVTPGPNNLMLMASGTSFGFRRTLPHMLGVSLGFGVMVLGVGCGLLQLFDVWPELGTALKAACLAYLLYLAWRIASAPTVADEEHASAARPMTFGEAALFQWINPKAWVMAISSVTLFAPNRQLLTIAMLAAVFTAVNLPSVGLWAYMGERLRLFLDRSSRRRTFNWLMAAFLVASVAPTI